MVRRRVSSICLPLYRL